MRIIIIVIAGATATGKTEVAIAVAERLDGEIISADSMQVYKYMDIGTAKPLREEQRGVPHYLIDELFPDEPFNIAVFKSMAQNHMEKILKNGKTPIIAGGTGFYINALIKNTEFLEGASDPEVRCYYESLAKSEGNKYIFDLLAKTDPLSAEKIHPNNVKRVVRALEFYKITGKSLAEHNKLEKSKIINDDILVFVLVRERSELYERIDKRVDKMINQGLRNEVETLLNMGYNSELTSMQGIGYKEMIKHIHGEYGLEEAIAVIKQASRNYAKRQVTWFKNQVNGIELDASLPPAEICAKIEGEIKRRKNAY